MCYANAHRSQVDELEGKERNLQQRQQVDEVMRKENNLIENSSISCDQVSSGLSNEDDNRRINQVEMPIDEADSASVENTHPVLLIE